MIKESNLYKAFLSILMFKNNKIPNNSNICFMLYDEVLNEIHKIELDDFDEWLNDGSFEKTDKLYLSIVIKEF